MTWVQHSFLIYLSAPLRGKMEPNGGLWAVLKLGSQVIYILLNWMWELQVKSFCEVGFIQSPPKVDVPPSFACILIAQCSVLSGLSLLLPEGSRASVPSWSVFPPLNSTSCADGTSP